MKQTVILAIGAVVSLLVHPGRAFPVAYPRLRPHKARTWEWLKPKAMTRGQRIVSYAILGFVIVLMFATFGTEYIGYPKVGGLSMAGTIDQPLYVPFGPEEVRHRGAYVHVDKSAKPVVWSIVMFQSEDGKERDVKRVDKIREDGALWVTADNVGVTGADSRELGWIMPDQIVGVVDQILTPARLWRSLTAEGRWINHLNFTFPPGCLYTLGKVVVVADKKGDVRLLDKAGKDIPLGTSNGQSLANAIQVRNGIMAVACDGCLVTVDLTTYEANRFPNSGRVAMACWLDDTHVCVRMMMAGLGPARANSDPDAIVAVR